MRQPQGLLILHVPSMSVAWSNLCMVLNRLLGPSMLVLTLLFGIMVLRLLQLIHLSSCSIGLKSRCISSFMLMISFW
jgi:hypothetical protein